MLAIQHKFDIAAASARISDAFVSGYHIKNWWTVDAELIPQVGAVGKFQWKPYKWEVKIKLEELKKGEVVRWKCIASNMQDTDAWVGTEMIFIIKALSDHCELHFSHKGYLESPCKVVCTDGWKFVLGTSLKQYLETGIGKPYGK